MQALEAASPPGAADSARQLRAELALFFVCATEARPEIRVRDGGGRPALDTAGGFEPRKLRREVRTREPELRWKRRAVDVERSLLGYRRPTKRAPHRHATKRARRA